MRKSYICFERKNIYLSLFDVRRGDLRVYLYSQTMPNHDRVASLYALSLQVLHL